MPLRLCSVRASECTVLDACGPLLRFRDQPKYVLFANVICYPCTLTVQSNTHIGIIGRNFHVFDHWEIEQKIN